MVRYAAFLRGINLGRRRVTGERLRVPFLDLGLTNVSTFLASGNVVFDADASLEAGGLTARIEAELENSLGFPVATVLRAAAELDEMVARKPFTTSELTRSAGKLQVILLRDEPGPEATREVLAHSSPEDRLALHGTELYWLPSGNMSASALDLRTIGRVLGVHTIRTGNTLARLHEKHFT